MLVGRPCPSCPIAEPASPPRNRTPYAQAPPPLQCDRSHNGTAELICLRSGARQLRQVNLASSPQVQCQGDVVAGGGVACNGRPGSAVSSIGMRVHEQDPAGGISVTEANLNAARYAFLLARGATTALRRSRGGYPDIWQPVRRSSGPAEPRAFHGPRMSPACAFLRSVRGRGQG